MSDDGGNWMEDADEEENQENRQEARTKTHIRKEEPVVEKTEAQLIIEAKQKKQEEDDAEKIKDLEERVRLQREREDEDLRKLKEKQAQRKKEREAEEQKLEEVKRQEQEQRRQEEEVRKAQKEEERRRKMEEIERRKAAQQAAMSGGRNFVIEKQNHGESTIDKFMNISKAKTEMSLNAGELETLKQRTVNERAKPLSLGDLDYEGLKTKVEELWKQIVSLETSRYDLTERHKRQEYDLKEMNERQRLVNQKKYVAQGLDSEASSRYPPKVQLVSKYERRIDRRTFSEKKFIFENERKGNEKELMKPSAKKREGWVKGKKPAGEEEEGNEENQENEGEEEYDNRQEVAADGDEEEE